MKNFHVHEMSDSSVLALSDIRDRIELSPDYQRPGGVWSLKNKQLFIDSLLNGYDIPKLYFHHLTGPFQKQHKDYAIIDGRQRLEAIWDFLDGKFSLADDFKFFDNEDFKAASMTFTEIEKKFPRLLIKLNARSLSVMVVTTTDLDFIEDMFSRLNEAVPLNAAEKRNAFGGPLPKIIRELSGHKFFVHKVAFSETRYRHHDVVAKLLLQEDSKTIVDTKKARLDAFVRDRRNKTDADFKSLVSKTSGILDRMCEIFQDKDTLLRSSGMVVVYYVTLSKTPTQILRQKLVQFEAARSENRLKFQTEDADANFTWIEYDQLAQSANDGAAIKERVEILSSYIRDA